MLDTIKAFFHIRGSVTQAATEVELETTGDEINSIKGD
jgi:hypothetical protein